VAPRAAVPSATAAAEEAARNAALDALCLEFADYDRELLAGMVEDQQGDAREVTLMLRRMKRQAAASQRQAAGGAAPGEKGAAAAKRKRG
jgi:hypothetical protein